jgi:hypothetical protein
VPGARKEFKGKERNKSKVPGARKEISGKGTEAEAKCQKQGQNLGEKIWEQKRSARSKEKI